MRVSSEMQASRVKKKYFDFLVLHRPWSWTKFEPSPREVKNVTGSSAPLVWDRKFGPRGGGIIASRCRVRIWGWVEDG